MSKEIGFTLIELLVVIAIIAILAAVLFPAFLTAEQHAQKASCASGIKQLSMAFRIYADDNGDTVPPNYTFSTQNYPNGEANNTWWLWMHYVYPYVKTVKVYNCPTATGKFKGGYYWEGGTSDPEMRPLSKSITFNASYGYNRWLGRYIYENTPSLKYSLICRSTATPLLADCSYYLTGPQYGVNNFVPSARHDGLTVMSFVDGHAQAVKRENWITNNARSVSDPVWCKWDPLLQ